MCLKKTKTCLYQRNILPSPSVKAGSRKRKENFTYYPVAQQKYKFMKKKTMKKVTPKKLKEKADKLFSEYIRQKYSLNGLTSCYTCSTRLPWKEMQNGHFVSRVHLSTRWEEKNCRPQCMPCNIWRKGNYDEYSRNLVREMGPSILDDLNRLKNTIKQMRRADYELLIEELELKIKSL